MPPSLHRAEPPFPDSSALFPFTSTLHYESASATGNVQHHLKLTRAFTTSASHAHQTSSIGPGEDVQETSGPASARLVSDVLRGAVTVAGILITVTFCAYVLHRRFRRGYSSRHHAPGENEEEPEHDSCDGIRRLSVVTVISHTSPRYYHNWPVESDGRDARPKAYERSAHGPAKEARPPTYCTLSEPPPAVVLATPRGTTRAAFSDGMRFPEPGDRGAMLDLNVEFPVVSGNAWLCGQC